MSRHSRTRDTAKSTDVVIEIPKGSRNKYEFDHEKGRIRLDRTLFTSTGYPADYGFVPRTLAEDGDPIDALVLLDAPTFPGCVVSGRVVAVFWMTDEHGPDAKLLCVPADDARYRNINDIGDVPSHLLHEIAHFFDVYKRIEPHKKTETRGWEGAAAAVAALQDARERFPANGHGASAG
jgi:inorganic pyrophosphatase